ncbi:DNA phosphorothioation-dependent restriction protein DptG [Neptunomonas japonica]|uniref:DNA phosphorothioation-dependent restriction protein DptG n=1 Tax=Neptunomonas japonica JAMM 1380 TaxID=1441457 RepID=A0A7R6SY88_9GAMM|nr:DNA phosphorothioation-dependent restriction protein DptG [Neptunomonas japonica]BBB31487.1 DNA phosphorothioation-dependent restriction protein DptG [Neptunomonas japonica JAMM 1380]
MSILKATLTPGNNVLNSYFPARTGNNEGDFDWDIAKAIVVRNLYRKQLSTKFTKGLPKDPENKESSAINAFRTICKADFKERLDEAGLWEYLEEMYFSGEALYSVTPEALLFKLAPLTGNSPQHRLADMFSSLMQGLYIESPIQQETNFLEQQVVESLRSEEVLSLFERGKKTLSKGINEKSFLPFLTKHFRSDLKFLASHPKYLIDQLQNLLKLYGYLYTAQLALNIKGLDCEPTAKPLYFIMENETASRERTDLVRNGHQTVARLLVNIFPYLSMSEGLQDVSKEDNEHRLPLWQLAQKLTDDDSNKLREYAEAFALNRNESLTFLFPYDKNNTDPRYWLNVLLELAVQQFDKGMKRSAAQIKFIKATEDELCSTFVKARGQVGKVLVMNQDYIALITNIAIGIKDKLRFHELLTEFNSRGIYFDKQSQQALIRFYERVGNVERMSDSGDAVYVRKIL